MFTSKNVDKSIALDFGLLPHSKEDACEQRR